LARTFNRVIMGLRPIHSDETHRQCGPPHPAPSADGLVKAPAAGHPLPQGGEGS
jgi:hypothetical protein